MAAGTQTIDEAAVQEAVAIELEHATDRAQRTIDAIADRRRDLQVAFRIKQSYEKVYPGDLLSVHFDYVYQCVEFRAFLNDFASLQPFLGLIRKYGYQRHKDTKKPKKDYLGGLFYRYVRDGQSDSIRLTVSALDREGAACKLVEVGKKTIATYEIQCHGKPITDIADPEPAEEGTTQP